MLDAIKKFIRWIIGPPWDSREYKKMKKRVKALPKDYNYMFIKIWRYLVNNGVDPHGPDIAVYTDLLDLFETNIAAGKHVMEVIGSDVGEFCNELIRTAPFASAIHDQFAEKFWGNINKDIAEKFRKEGK